MTDNLVDLKYIDNRNQFKSKKELSYNYISLFFNYKFYCNKLKNKRIISKIISVIIIILLVLLLFIILLYFKPKKNSNKISNNKSFANSNKTRKFFFLEKKEELHYCKNYGIFTYNYPTDRPRPRTGNVGDYIQSLAALQYLPKDCLPYYVDRDDIEFYNGTNVTTIMNGWYRIVKGNIRVSKKISPIFVSIHIHNIKKINSIYINTLKKYEPIGCRDTYTFNALKSKGINAYFSSCLTTTLDIDYSVDDSERTNNIYFVDYKFGYNDRIDSYIKSLKVYNFSKSIFIHHRFRLKLPEFKRFQLAKLYLDRYARAKLVVTTRLHCALPCLVLKTPLIFVNRRFDRRYHGLYEFLNRVGINSTGQFQIKVNFDENNYVVNPKEYLKYANNLKQILNNI